MVAKRVVVAAGLAVLAVSPPAQAQSDPRLNAIEAQIRALQVELGRVRRDLAQRDKELRETRKAQPAPPVVAAAPAPPAGQPVNAPGQQASVPGTPEGPFLSPGNLAPPSSSAPPAPANPGGISFPRGRPTFTSSDGVISAAVGVQLNYDIGGIFQGSRTPPDTRQFPRLNTLGENLRRARIPFVFKYDDFQVNLTPDFGGSPDGSPTLFEASLSYNPSVLKPLTVSLGYFKPSYTLSDSTSSNDLFFLERPSIINIARSEAAGVARAAVGARYAEKRFFLASYLTGSPYGSQSTNLAAPQQTGATLRVAGRPVAGADTDVHLGFSGSDSFRFTRTAAGVQTFDLRDFPELRIDDNRLVSTGGLAARSGYTYGGEFAARYKSVLFEGEYYRIGLDRTNGGAAVQTPGLEFSGGYALLSWMITGEERRYVVTSATFGNPAVKRPFSLRNGGLGAFEAVARFSEVNLNANVTPGRSAASTGGVYGGEQKIYSIGLNWYPNDHFKFLLDYDIIQVDRLNAAGTTQIGQRIQAVALRGISYF